MRSIVRSIAFPLSAWRPALGEERSRSGLRLSHPSARGRRDRSSLGSGLRRERSGPSRKPSAATPARDTSAPVSCTLGVALPDWGVSAPRYRTRALGVCHGSHSLRSSVRPERSVRLVKPSAALPGGCASARRRPTRPRGLRWRLPGAFQNPARTLGSCSRKGRLWALGRRASALGRRTRALRAVDAVARCAPGRSTSAWSRRGCCAMRVGLRHKRSHGQSASALSTRDPQTRMHRRPVPMLGRHGHTAHAFHFRSLRCCLPMVAIDP